MALCAIGLAAQADLFFYVPSLVREAYGISLVQLAAALTIALCVAHQCSCTSNLLSLDIQSPSWAGSFGSPASWIISLSSIHLLTHAHRPKPG